MNHHDGQRELEWLPAGQGFAPEALVHWQGKVQGQPLETVLPGVHTVVLGPHAGVALPGELRPFIASGLSRRQQYDYADWNTGPLGRAWAAATPGLLFIENPHARLVQDPNRPPPSDPLAMLREFHARLARQRAGEPGISFAGVDAVRPLSFAGAEFLPAPPDEAGWQALGRALAQCRRLGWAPYQAAVSEVLERRLALAPQRPLLLLSLHDTMNTRMGPDGALDQARAPAERLPDWVNFGNLGDAHGEAPAGTAESTLSLAPQRLRRIVAAWQQALQAPAGAFTLNTPYRGAYETQHWGALVRRRGAAGSGALQLEFRRETLLGAEAVAWLRRPGRDWPPLDTAHLQRTAQALSQAVLIEVAA